jgi:hypothetical protein
MVELNSLVGGDSTNADISSFMADLEANTASIKKQFEGTTVNTQNKIFEKNKASIMAEEFEPTKAKIQEIAKQYNAAVCQPGTRCYDAKTITKLKQKWNDAQLVKANNPHELYQAKKAYLTFKFSKHYFNTMEQERYKEEAKTAHAEIDTLHENRTKNLDVLTDSYSNYNTNIKNIRDYISKLKTDNKQLNYKIRNKLSTLNTNERKVWYEKHELGFMSNWTKLMFCIYYLFVIVYIYYFITEQLWKANDYRNNKIYIALLILFLSWGFINMHISAYIFKIIHFFIGLIPIDAYSKL